MHVRQWDESANWFGSSVNTVWFIVPIKAGSIFKLLFVYHRLSLSLFFIASVFLSLSLSLILSFSFSPTRPQSVSSSFPSTSSSPSFTPFSVSLSLSLSLSARAASCYQFWDPAAPIGHKWAEQRL